jgi:peptidylprolyl isomerase
LSNDRRRQRPNQRSNRRRRTPQSTYQPAGPVQFTGVMGFFQRHTRAFFLVGIVVMLASLGSFIFAQRISSTAAKKAAQSAATAEASPTGTPDANATPAVVRTYSAPPPMTIDASKTYEAVIHLDAGDVHLQLLPDAAPGYVNNFVFLAQHHFYDGLTFHRVVPGFVAQAGDPTGSGLEDAGYSLTEEHNNLPFTAGVISMAKAGTRVSSSQFFITLAPAGSLDGNFTVFGRVTSGLELLQQLPARDPTQPNPPAGVVIKSIDITEGPAG